MRTFVYLARNKQGERVEGRQHATDKAAALQALRQAGLFVTKIEVMAPAAPKTSAVAESKWWLRAGSRDLSLYFRQMQAMLHSGTSLAAALSTMATSAPHRNLRQASAEMARSVSHGTAWSEEMRRFPGLFSPLALAMIRSGEVGGFLDRSCARLADYAERDQKIAATIARETWYPKLVVFSAILILNAPPLVVSLMQGGAFLPAFWQYLRRIGMPFGVIFLLWLLTSGQKFIMPLMRHLRPVSLVLDQIKLLVPIVGQTVRKLAIAKFCRAFAALNAAGVSVASSFTLAANACGNAAIAARIRGVIPQVQSGQSITDALTSTNQFQTVALQMIRTGEMSGNFEEQLNSVAEFMEDEGETSIRKSANVLGILALLAVGIMVGNYVINFWMNYYGALLGGTGM